MGLVFGCAYCIYVGAAVGKNRECTYKEIVWLAFRVRRVDVGCVCGRVFRV